MKWESIELYVFKLQKIFFQASKNNNELEMIQLQKILINSKAAKLKAVRKVTQDNTGKRPQVSIILKICSRKKD